MPIARPTLTDLFLRMAADVASHVPGADATVRRSMLRALVSAEAGSVHGIYGFVENISRQVIATTAEGEFLDRIAAMWSVSRKPATLARLSVEFSGSEGAAIPLGTLIRRGVTEYQTLTVEAIVGGVAAVEVEAALPGTVGNAEPGDTLSLVSAVPGIASSSTVLAVTVVGVDEESDVDLRGRLVRRISLPVNGGAADDYVTWSLEVPGVTRAWVFPQLFGRATVGVGFVTDDAPGGIFPDPAKVAEVQAYLDDPARRPVTAEVTVIQTVAKAWDMTIELEPNDLAVQAAVEAELADLFFREGVPGQTLPLTHVAEAISTTPGETDHDLQSPVLDLTHLENELPVLGVVTWV